MVRERLADICRALQAALHTPALRQATGDDAMFEKVAEIIENRATALLQSPTTAKPKREKRRELDQLYSELRAI